MFADTLLALERAHLLRLLVWGAACVLLGTLVLAALAARRAEPRLDSPLLKHFAIQTAAWGALALARGSWGLGRLRLRDYAAAAELSRDLWLAIGLDVGFLAAGVTMAVTGWALGRRLAPVGAGLAVAVQGAALLVLDRVLAARIGPYI